MTTATTHAAQREEVGRAVSPRREAPYTLRNAAPSPQRTGHRPLDGGLNAEEDEHEGVAEQPSGQHPADVLGRCLTQAGARA